MAKPYKALASLHQDAKAGPVADSEPLGVHVQNTRCGAKPLYELEMPALGSSKRLRPVYVALAVSLHETLSSLETHSNILRVKFLNIFGLVFYNSNSCVEVASRI